MTLILGTDPDDVRLFYVAGEPFEGGMRLFKTVDGVKAAEPWPAAPVIVFENGVTWTATISDGDTPGVANRATWVKNGTDTGLIGKSGSLIRIRVEGRSAWTGVTVEQ